MRRIEIVSICFRCVEKQHFDRLKEQFQSLIERITVNICNSRVDTFAVASKTRISLGVKNSYRVVQLVTILYYAYM